MEELDSSEDSSLPIHQHNFAFWNCRHIQVHNKSSDLVDVARSLNLDVIALSETSSKQNCEKQLPPLAPSLLHQNGYTYHLTASSRVGFLVRDEFFAENNVELVNAEEHFQVLKIRPKNQPTMAIASIYAPVIDRTSPFTKELGAEVRKQLFDSLSSLVDSRSTVCSDVDTLFLVGDFNARTSMNGDTFTCPIGKLFLNWCKNNDCEILNDKQEIVHLSKQSIGTHVDVAHHSSTTIDYALRWNRHSSSSSTSPSSSSHLVDVESLIITDHLLDSDHRLIQLNVSTQGSKSLISSVKNPSKTSKSSSGSKQLFKQLKFKVTSASSVEWDQFSVQMASNALDLNNFYLKCSNDSQMTAQSRVDACVDLLALSMQKSASAIIGTFKTRNGKTKKGKAKIKSQPTPDLDERILASELLCQQSQSDYLTACHELKPHAERI